jgi:hypothetical protein
MVGVEKPVLRPVSDWWLEEIKKIVAFRFYRQ